MSIWASLLRHGILKKIILKKVRNVRILKLQTLSTAVKPLPLFTDVASDPLNPYLKLTAEMKL